MAKRISINFVIAGKVEATLHLGSLPVLEPKSRRGKKKKVIIDTEDLDAFSEDTDKRTQAVSDSNDSYATNSKTTPSKKGRGRGGGRKKKVQDDDEDLNEFPAPKSRPGRGRGGARRGRGRKADSVKGEDESAASSSKNGGDSPSLPDENLDIEEEEMKLEDDDDELMDEEDEDDDNFEEGLNTLSTKNILRMTKIQQDESANSDKNSVTDINTLNIDVNKLTRRQKMQLKNQANLNIDVEEPLMQLPDKKPRKKKVPDLTEEQQVKKMESANKRRMLNQKLQEEQKKMTINKILNEAGRKQKMRKEQEEKSTKGKDARTFKTLPEGEVGIKYISRSETNFLVLPEGFEAQSLLANLN